MLTPTVIEAFDAKAPDTTETATFGLGCFWGPDAAAGALDGVVRTRVGYAGGTTPEPSYDAMGDHTEVVQLKYDPDQLSFGDLLEWAFAEHHPYKQPKKRQYQHIVFTETADQRDQLQTYLANAELDREEIETRLEPLEDFHVAEEYHQKFQLRGKRWITEAFDGAGYDATAVRESPAAAKLNAHAAGHDVDVPFLEPSYDRRSA
ncbi:peptide-methionine (S)-S-oxide reductase [Halopiger aswanensis]|uniref:peptide-methionine (S)-S-oxide reductase n=1 Tax=Halopiger aswanensis TaxID=148449 RepID=A0A3R7GT95_9EURY|nr:peptide-methionine (S)-S-oxide reductase [Halopiger aswanensis]RKD88910.1 peptide-methionine (S)-S-oxide reductase [Halopiger aswanensis]